MSLLHMSGSLKSIFAMFYSFFFCFESAHLKTLSLYVLALSNFMVDVGLCERFVNFLDQQRVLRVIGHWVPCCCIWSQKSWVPVFKISFASWLLSNSMCRLFWLLRKVCYMSIFLMGRVRRTFFDFRAALRDTCIGVRNDDALLGVFMSFELLNF